MTFRSKNVEKRLHWAILMFCRNTSGHHSAQWCWKNEIRSYTSPARLRAFVDHSRFPIPSFFCSRRHISSAVVHRGLFASADGEVQVIVGSIGGGGGPSSPSPCIYCTSPGETWMGIAPWMVHRGIQPQGYNSSWLCFEKCTLAPNGAGVLQVQSNVTKQKTTVKRIHPKQRTVGEKGKLGKTWNVDVCQSGRSFPPRLSRFIIYMSWWWAAASWSSRAAEAMRQIGHGKKKLQAGRSMLGCREVFHWRDNSAWTNFSACLPKSAYDNVTFDH